jgi:hypothetical protein
MVRNGDGRHASPLQKVVNFEGLAIALLTQVLEPGKVEHSGSLGVNMEVAAHEVILGVEYEQPVKKWQNLGKCADGTY